MVRANTAIEIANIALFQESRAMHGVPTQDV
jgi:hypothetical protein